MGLWENAARWAAETEKGWEDAMNGVHMVPHFLRRERSNGRVAIQMQLDWQKNLPLLQMVVGVRENLRSRPGGCFQATKWASKCISLLSVGVSS